MVTGKQAAGKSLQEQARVMTWDESINRNEF